MAMTYHQCELISPKRWSFWVWIKNERRSVSGLFTNTFVLDACHNEGRYALGVVVSYGLTDIVFV